jgi:hypothetical protein
MGVTTGYSARTILLAGRRSPDAPRRAISAFCRGRSAEPPVPAFPTACVSWERSAAPVSLILRAPRLTLLVALSLAGFVTSCSQPPIVPTPSPSSPSPPVPPPAPTGPLTGVVFEATEQGRRPIPGAQVTIVDLVDGPYGFLGFIELATDANGRFALAPRRFSNTSTRSPPSRRRTATWVSITRMWTGTPFLRPRPSS